MENHKHLRGPNADATHGGQTLNDFVIIAVVNAGQVKAAIANVCGEITHSCKFGPRQSCAAELRFLEL
jgi:hypothetical protein